MIHPGDQQADTGVTLRPNDITFEAASAVDPFGRVFWHEGNVYRAVSEPFVGFAEEILPRFPAWAAHGLVETGRAGIGLEGSPLVLAHKRIPFASYCTEWLPQMLRDAALCYLGLQAQLIRDGYVLKDGHPWNLLFDGGQPVYVDVGSITRYEPRLLERALREFRLYFLLPLRLFKAWGSDKTYRFLNRPIPNHEERSAVAREIGVRDGLLSRWLGPERELKWLIRHTARLGGSTGHATEWSAYEQKAPAVTDPESFVDKQRPAYKTLRRVGGGTALDIGCNKGWYSILAETMGYEVVSVDIDIESLDVLYDRVKAEKRRILPLRMDICEPTPSNGLGEAYPGFLDRMKCDVVLAMAVIHHLAYKRKLSFETFADRIATLARKAAVVEFIPREDQYVSKWDQAGMEWYTREGFRDAFLRHFRKVEAFPSTPAPREVFVCEK